MYRLAILLLTFAVITPTASADYSSTVLSDNPVAYYRFEEADGAGDLIDSSGNGHNSLDVIDVEFGAEGVVGAAAEFFGFSSIVLDLNIDPNDPEGDGEGVGQDDFTIETWVYTTGVEEIDDPVEFGRLTPGMHGAEIVLLFCDPYTLDVQRLLRAINHHEPGLRIAGGWQAPASAKGTMQSS